VGGGGIIRLNRLNMDEDTMAAFFDSYQNEDSIPEDFPEEDGEEEKLLALTN
jgi:hypothetical protein